MPLYQQIIGTMPKYSSEKLVNLFKLHAKIVMEHGGIIRGKKTFIIILYTVRVVVI
jgi:hypothetical protein